MKDKGTSIPPQTVQSREDAKLPEEKDPSFLKKSQKEGPAAYAPHNEDEVSTKPGDPAKKKTGVG